MAIIHVPNDRMKIALTCPLARTCKLEGFVSFPSASLCPLPARAAVYTRMHMGKIWVLVFG